ncbi:murein biosynthesis integral membrane protein MurJ [Planctomycetota bacterium]|nr:murein biosynthesis integral membrane protein MurJ [Planctomycetota bacterium]
MERPEIDPHPEPSRPPDRHRRLALRTALVSSLTLVSRVLGYAREMLAAALFGDTSGVFDAFLTAFRVPNLFRRFLGEGALATSFQTALTEVDESHGERAGAVLFRKTLGLMMVVSFILSLLVMAAVSMAPDQLPGTEWAWLGADPDAVRDLTIRVMPFLVLVCLSALVTGALHVRGKFGAPAFAPAAMNLAWIATLLVIAWHFGWGDGSEPGVGSAGQVERHVAMARWLAWGLLLAGLVQLVVQWPALRKAGLLGGREGLRALPEGAPGPGEVLRRSAPLALGAAVYQINVMVDGLMAESLLSNGGPTAHYYANRVQQFPLALVAVAATSAVFPALQQLGHRRELQALRRLHDRTHLAIVAVALPAAVGLFVLARPVVEVSFEHGAFGPEGVDRTTRALKALCFAIVPAGATGLVARTYYSVGDFSTPVKVSAAMLVLNGLLNVLFLVVLGMDVEGLAAATAVTSALNVAMLLPGLTRRLGLPKSEVPFRRALPRMVAASVVSGVAAGAVERTLEGALGPALALFLAIGAGGGAYLGAALALGIEDVRAISKKVLARLRPGRR